MANDRDLQLNSVARYTKRSPTLVLEEHSHCEVPAGCGGVVLRWIDPHQAIPVTFWVYAPFEYELFLDGQALASAEAMVGHGRHVIALRFGAADPKTALFALAADYKQNPPGSGPQRTGGALVELSILSAGDRSWKGTARPPEGDDWTQPGFDDAAWEPLVERPMRKLERQESGAWHQQKVAETGARPIGLPGARGPVWVRRAFELVLAGAP
jgi:hypothetical protein